MSPCGAVIMGKYVKAETKQGNSILETFLCKTVEKSTFLTALHKKQEVTSEPNVDVGLTRPVSALMVMIYGSFKEEKSSKDQKGKHDYIIYVQVFTPQTWMMGCLNFYSKRRCQFGIQTLNVQSTMSKIKHPLHIRNMRDVQMKHMHLAQT